MVTSSPHEITLRFTGEFSLAASVSLAASASFVEGFSGGDEAGALDLAFPLEGSWSPVGVRVCQHDDGGVRARVLANPGGATTDDVRAQLERILSLDVDGAGFADVAARDDVVAGLHRLRPGLRPVLFPSPYEAAARAIIGHQLPVRQAAAVSARIAQEHGVALTVGDRVMHAFPAPDRLADLPPVRGLAVRKVEQLRVLAAPPPTAGSPAPACARWTATKSWRTSSSYPASGRSPPSWSCCAARATPTPSPGTSSVSTGRWPPPTVSATRPTSTPSNGSPSGGAPTAAGSVCCCATNPEKRPIRWARIALLP